MDYGYSVVRIGSDYISDGSFQALKPDAYIPFYPTAFFAAVEGHADHIAVGYLRAICHYWVHMHCKGLPNDSEFLRKVCRIEKEQWEYAMEIIFDNNHFFTLGEDDLWHQKRAAEEWEKSMLRYSRAVEAAKASWRSPKRRRR